MTSGDRHEASDRYKESAYLGVRPKLTITVPAGLTVCAQLHKQQVGCRLALRGGCVGVATLLVNYSTDVGHWSSPGASVNN